ncbi:15-methylpalmitoyl-4-hydroxy-2-pyrone synthase [Halobacillus karajensis]|uniref:Alpha-pyrone synthesis polyketide synthase-like Pks11 n=1 Tax=Halobacillus karajensis TaxID=195088 RepID=A0A024P325_9BACI|nr:naringenin-chalcone synthase [Halobacillus karajensis]CDQ19550.1 Alpha-pyrone synthesis polyketide synthase-like Pks11 [Halobacillus karajensis]CDQ22012.1 Alpha-pyrone synthesis polyketide synthase-like Pks11 [Halobacillus karajensis]CDQ27853.1 Alpha-pyrone synthesis polyketide synthase-like Pks11 [Halobacillus karajensis]SEH80408.1 15-methylpalmitoyl-4-hydroxy-2-pyrone synthase [Halobacillus karajensis]
MPYILSSGIQCAEYPCLQTDVQKLVYDLFPLKENEKKRLLPIFEHANIEERQFAAPLSWFKEPRGLEERNTLYHHKALKYSIEAIQSCLSGNHLSEEVPPYDVDHIIFVSSTGISTPTLDTYIMNELGFRDDTKRSPLFGLGCAGGTSGLARAYEWLIGHPSQSVLVVCVELCSLTFQPEDSRVSNFVGTALFGDGASAVLVVGDKSKWLKRSKRSLANILNASSKTKQNSTDVMGWRIVDTGFEVIFNKSIPKLVRQFWSMHADEVIKRNGWAIQELPFIIAHPGGRKVLEAYQEVFNLGEKVLDIPRKVLACHGNMSSPTVHFVLHEVLSNQPGKGTKSMMTSLGPGFSSEIISLEWM